MRRLPALALLLSLTTALSPVHAAQRTAKTNTSQPALISADRISYDEDLGIVVASGHVEIVQDDRILHADAVTYNQRADSVTASGNVSLLQPSGEVVFASYFELSGDLKNGVAQNFRMLMTDHSRMAAAGARRTNGTLTEMTKGVYSPCDLCKSDPERPPLWELKADRITHDNVEHQIYYQDATLDMFGFPVAYTPYISTPDPTVKRRSGFLAPIYGVDSLVGEELELPYFWAISPDKDVTIAPVFTTKSGVVFNGQYRERWDAAKMEVEGGFTESPAIDEFGASKPGQQSRWYIRGDGVYDIDPAWRAGYDAQRESDDSFLLRYKTLWQPPTIMQSDLYAEDFFSRSYQSIYAYAFQDLYANVSYKVLPIVAPIWSLNYMSQPGSFGQYWTVDTSALDLFRISGPSAQRLSSREQWHLPYTSPAGDTTTLTASLQTDGYVSTNNPNPNNPSSPTGQQLSGRALPQAKLDWRWPWARQDGDMQEVIEPHLAAIVGPQGRNGFAIPNEDSLDFELDDQNIYNLNPFPGVDRVDGGDRFVYGSSFGAYGKNGGNATFFMGEAYSFQKNHAFNPYSGFTGNFSNYVGRLQIRPAGGYLHLDYQFMLRQEDFAPRRSEANLTIGPPALNAGLYYISATQQISGQSALGLNTVQQLSSQSIGRVEQVIGTVSSRLTQYWTVSANATRDLTDEQFRSIYFGGQYHDECLTVNIMAVRNFIHVRDITSGTTVLVQFIFKNLGEVNVSGSFGGTSAPPP